MYVDFSSREDLSSIDFSVSRFLCVSTILTFPSLRLCYPPSPLQFRENARSLQRSRPEGP